MNPTFGNITWDSEGNDDENSKYFTRKLHLPPGASGVTIGRGYDMKERTAPHIKSDLKNAGVTEEWSGKLSEGAGKTGKDAQAIVDKYKDFRLTHEQQLKLFEKVYNELKSDVVRILKNEYNKIDFAKLVPILQDLLVDLRYRGDFTVDSRKHLMPVIDDYKKVVEVFSDKKLWSNVPQDRFNRRVELANILLKPKVLP